MKIRTILTDKKGLKHFIGLRHFYEAPVKSRAMLVVYFLFMALTFLVMEFTVFSNLRNLKDL